MDTVFGDPERRQMLHAPRSGQVPAYVEKNPRYRSEKRRKERLLRSHIQQQKLLVPTGSASPHTTAAGGTSGEASASGLSHVRQQVRLEKDLKFGFSQVILTLTSSVDRSV